MKLKQPLIYLASPHSHTDKDIRYKRYLEVLTATTKFIEKGFFIFSPIVNSHYVGVALYESGVDCNNFDYWKDLDTELITRMDEMWVLCIDGWKESKGVQAEIEIARLQGKVVLFLFGVDTHMPVIVSDAEGYLTGTQQSLKRKKIVSDILNSDD